MTNEEVAAAAEIAGLCGAPAWVGIVVDVLAGLQGNKEAQARVTPGAPGVAEALEWLEAQGLAQRESVWVESIGGMGSKWSPTASGRAEEERVQSSPVSHPFRPTPNWRG